MHEAILEENRRLRAALRWFYELHAEGVFSVPDKDYGVIANAADILWNPTKVDPQKEARET